MSSIEVISCLRNLDLDLVGDAAVGIGPVERLRETAGRRGRRQRARHVIRLHAHHPGPLAIQRHIHGRIIERLAELHVAQECSRLSFSRTLSAKARSLSRFGPLTATSIGVGEPRLITRLTMSRGSKENLTSGICSRTAGAGAPLARQCGSVSRSSIGPAARLPAARCSTGI